ncbi:survival protein sure-like phosphatase/nucleotidase [Cyathus striatus]|nr:survival protein sure-like phosphatase/nucleotidase [Cyathus striatus]
MQLSILASLISLVLFPTTAQGASVNLRATPTKIVLTNDDGWAVAQIRAEYSSLRAAGFDVILSAPADNKSGTGSSSATPTPLTSPCEFNSCPSGSPATGSNSSDTRLNYVNAFPVDAVRFGIQTLAPEIFGTKPDLVVSGSNIGTNLGSISGSGTVGAASEAALEGIPSIAFSGTSGSQVSYTTLTSTPNASSTASALIYTDLIIKFVNALTNNTTPWVPSGISINVNFASTSSCASANDFKYIFTRLVSSSSATDITTCGTNHLPAESTVVKAGCFATVSVFDASTKKDVNATTQAAVHSKLTSTLSCM